MTSRKGKLSSEKAERKWRSAIQGLENLGLSEKADEIAALDPTEYAESKGYQVQNPAPTYRRREVKRMARRETREELLDRVEELEAENESLQADLESATETLDSISELLGGEDSDSEESSDDE